MKRGHLACLLAVITLLFHAIGNPHYGFFRDELYFIICGRHPAWGYVDQPPLTPLLAAGTQLFGHSLFLLRLVPAICAAAAVYITCLFVIELGAGAFAIILASVCVALAPVLASFGMKQSTDMLGMPLWPLAALFALRAIGRAQPKWWIATGLTLGIAFNAKYSLLFFAAALIAGILISPQRAALFNRWFAAGVGIAVLLALPNALWQALHGLPMLELLRNGAQGKNVVLSPAYLGQELLITNPILALVWIAGLIWVLVTPGLRWIGYAFLLLIGMMIAFHAKHYYPAAVYPILFATGAIAIEVWTRRFQWPRIPAVALATVFGVLMLPLVMPVLALQTFIAYQSALHIAPTSSEHTRLKNLPQDYADMFGWPEMESAVAAVYRGLPEKDRSGAAIFADNYGEAAALDFFGARDGLPPALSGHNQYFLWGPRGYSGNVLIAVNGPRAQLLKVFRSVQLATVFSNPNGRPLEDGFAIYVCRGIRVPLATLWPKTKNYI